MNLKWQDHGIKTPLARARGLGAAHDGVQHWLAQRITAIANIPLGIWFVYSIVDHAGVDYTGFVEWLAVPWNAILMILFLLSAFYHAALGTQVVAEDYIHSEGMKIAILIGLKLFFFAMGVACVFSVLKIAFAG
jgi:succinate dehydrogenase / fumarate reductase membrane anchor subunit